MTQRVLTYLGRNAPPEAIREALAKYEEGAVVRKRANGQKVKTPGKYGAKVYLYPDGQTNIRQLVKRGTRYVIDSSDGRTHQAFAWVREPRAIGRAIQRALRGRL